MDTSHSLRLEDGCALSLGPMWQSRESIERSPDSVARQNSSESIPTSRKRVRDDGANDKDAPSSKANREKMRRDRLNDRFLELARELDPAASSKVDKTVILGDTVRLLVRLKAETASLLQDNLQIQDQIKELKAEKSEMREEKARLKAERDRLRMHLHSLTSTFPMSNGVPTQLSTQLSSQPLSQLSSQASTTLFQQAPILSSYAQQTPVKPEALPLTRQHVAMWPWLAPAAAETFRDQILTPPVA